MSVSALPWVIMWSIRKHSSLKNSSGSEVNPQTGLSGQVGLPDHSLKQVLNNQMWLSHHKQQGHMGPRKLEWQAQTNTEWTVEMLSTNSHNDNAKWVIE